MKNCKMNLLKSSGAIALAATLMTSAAAGEKAGNGGIGYLCNGEVLLLDYLEAQERGIQIEAPQGKTTVAKIVNAWLDELARKDSVRAEKYRSLANPMLEDIEKFDGRPMLGKTILFTDLGNIDTRDGAEQMKPDERVGCEKRVQIVVQKAPAVPEDRLFRIDYAYWAKMSPLQQALTVMHELVYHEAISLGHKDSFATRYLNSKIASVDFASMSACSWRDLLVTRSFAFQYRVYQTDAIECDERGVVRKVIGWNSLPFASGQHLFPEIRFLGLAGEIPYPVFYEPGESTVSEIRGGMLKLTVSHVIQRVEVGPIEIGQWRLAWVNQTDCREIEGRIWAQVLTYSRLKTSKQFQPLIQRSREKQEKLNRKRTRAKEFSYPMKELCSDGRVPDVLFVNGVQVF